MQVTPHGMCFFCQQNILLLHALSDALLAVAFFAISVSLAIFAARRQDLPFRPLFYLFATVIATCGATRLLAIWAIWHGHDWLESALNAVAAILSLSTAIALIAVAPKALALRSTRELEQRNLSLESAGAEIQATIEQLGEGVVVFDDNLNVLRVNRLAQELIAVRDAHDQVVDGDGNAIPRAEWPVAVARETGLAQRTVMGFGPEDDRRWVAVSATPIRIPGSTDNLDRIVMSLREVTDLKAGEQQQRDYARQLHSLHLIATMTTDHRKKQIDAALLVGLEPLGLERAFLGAIDVAANELVIECSVALPGSTSPPIEVGTRYPVRGTLVGRVLKQKKVLTVLDLAAERKSTGYTQYAGSGCYIAVPIFVEGVAYGSIGFVGSVARTTAFTRENIEFVKLAGDLIASAILRDLQTERLDTLAFFDALTGLPNRVLLYDRMVQMINASERRGEQFAVLYVDLDGFKAVNDRYGHAAGDGVLKGVAARLRDILRESDTVARMGGDEFIVLAAGISTRLDAAGFAERVLWTLRQPVDDGERMHRISASVGVSMYPTNGRDMNTLIGRADLALYEAKHGGKNQVRFAPNDDSLDTEHGPFGDDLARLPSALSLDFSDSDVAP